MENLSIVKRIFTPTIRPGDREQHFRSRTGYRKVRERNTLSELYALAQRTTLVHGRERGSRYLPVFRGHCLDCSGGLGHRPEYWVGLCLLGSYGVRGGIHVALANSWHDRDLYGIPGSVFVFALRHAALSSRRVCLPWLHV